MGWVGSPGAATSGSGASAGAVGNGAGGVGVGVGVAGDPEADGVPIGLPVGVADQSLLGTAGVGFTAPAAGGVLGRGNVLS